MWRIVVILLALATLFMGTARIAAERGPVVGEARHAVLSDECARPSGLVVVPAHDDCSELACCSALHCSSCAFAVGPEFPGHRIAELGWLVHDDPALLRTGRVIAPPTAPPRSRLI